MMNWDDPLGTSNSEEVKKPQAAKAEPATTTPQPPVAKEADTAAVNVTPENTYENAMSGVEPVRAEDKSCLLYTSPSPRD